MSVLCFHSVVKCFPVLGAFAKLRKATISVAMSVSDCPSARMEQLSSHWTDCD